MYIFILNLFQWIGQRQLQDETRKIYVWGLGATYIRELTVYADGSYAISWIH